MALGNAVTPEGALWDVDRNTTSPTSHYGALSTALALLIQNPEDRRCDALLKRWLSLNSKALGHLPFNRLLLLLMRIQVCKSHRLTRDIEHGLKRCPLRQSYPSNNWTLLAQACRVLQASKRKRGREIERYLRVLSYWMTPSGGFVDFPAHRYQEGEGATPIAYHHKVLFLTCLLAVETRDPALEAPLAKLFHWASMFWDGAGYSGGFGRSTHALFGDACLLASLILLGASESKAAATTDLPLMLDCLVNRLLTQQRSDGLIQLNPGSPNSWDSYMWLSVYNAWAAAIVLWAHQAMNSSSPLEQPIENSIKHEVKPSNSAVIREDRAAGLLRLDTPAGLTVFISTRGQPPQAFSRNECELRYAGGIPFHILVRGKPVCPPPIRIALRDLLARPALAGWTPLLLTEKGLFAATDFDNFQVEQSHEQITIRLTGTPTRLHRIAAESHAGKLRDAIDWRLLGGKLSRTEALRRERLSTVLVTLLYEFPLDRMELRWKIELTNTGSPTVDYLNPCGHSNVRLGSHTDNSTHNGLASVNTRCNKDHPEDWITTPLPAALATGYAMALTSEKLKANRTQAWTFRLHW